MRQEVAYAENFNPRSREGSDGVYKVKVPYTLNFNPRSREGSDERD